MGALRDNAKKLAFWLRHPRITVRARLTLLYGGLFLASSVVLLAITYLFLKHSVVIRSPLERGSVGVGPLPRSLPGADQFNGLSNLVSHQRLADLHRLFGVSVVALALMAVISIALGWLVAGRVLRPLRTMIYATQQISAENLHRRLALQGPRDELQDLGETIDGLLGRLEGAFDAQRRFVANASHELRTPLASSRALLEMTLNDPEASVETFRTTCRQALEEGVHQEQLIDALLILARGQRGLDCSEALDLASVAGGVIGRHESGANDRSIRLEASLQPSSISGDQRLIERLVSNLVENALYYNAPGGDVQVVVELIAGQPVLRVTNTGPVVPADQVDRLMQPFQRLAAERTGERDRVGLGLSIVTAIANAHGATVSAEPQSGGGLLAEVKFPEQRPRHGGRPSPPKNGSRPHNRHRSTQSAW